MGDPIPVESLGSGQIEIEGFEVSDPGFAQCRLQDARGDPDSNNGDEGCEWGRQC